MNPERKKRFPTIPIGEFPKREKIRKKKLLKFIIINASIGVVL